MSDVDIANDGEQFSRMLSRSLEQLTKRGLEATKEDFKQASKKILEPRAKPSAKFRHEAKERKISTYKIALAMSLTKISRKHLSKALRLAT